MKTSTLFILGLNKLISTRLTLNFSAQDILDYTKDKSTREYNPSLSNYAMNSFRELTLSTSNSLSDTLNNIKKEVQNLLNFTEKEKLTLVREFLLVEQGTISTHFGTTSDIPMPEGIPNEIEADLYWDIIKKVDQAISQVLHTPTVDELNKYLVYIPEGTTSDIKELLERFNKSFQQHRRKIKSKTPEELHKFITEEVWDTWYKDKDPELILQTKRCYLNLITKQNK